MLFLLKDGSYRLLDAYAEDRKIIKRFEKYKENLAAVLIESSTALHSDTFIIVEKDHFKTQIKPFYARYRLLLYDMETPIDYQNTISREIYISSIPEFFGLASLIYQVDACEDAGDLLSVGGMRVTITELEIRYEGEKESFTWYEDQESLIDFINRQDLFCDTDHFLDASLPRQQAVENGCYITRYNPKDQHSHIEYYHHDRKYYLCLYNGEWSLETKIPNPELDPLTANSFRAYGFCLNHTGLLYLASYPLAYHIFDVESCELILQYGRFFTEDKIWDTDTLMTREYDGFNYVDMLYMALYLPQIWDINHFLSDETPVRLGISLLQDKRLMKESEFELEKCAADVGLKCDLFAYIASTLTSPPFDITIDD